jgi:hypothetical protein
MKYLIWLGIFVPVSAYAANPQIMGCPIFPASSVWNTPVNTLPVHPNSDAYIAAIGASVGLHPDFGSDMTSGIPYNNVNGAAVAPVQVTFSDVAESDPGPYHIPANVQIEGGATSTGDRHILVIDYSRCVLEELFAATPNGDGTWSAYSGAKWDLTSNDLRGNGVNEITSADAAGLPILPGLVKWGDVFGEGIHHALRFTARTTQRSYVWPAMHYASSSTDPSLPPMGIRVRLKASFDISGFSPENQIILQALKTYGMILADNGSPWFISGVSSPRWNDEDLHQLVNVIGANFEVVDESAWEIAPSSSRVDPVKVNATRTN